MASPFGKASYSGTRPKILLRFIMAKKYIIEDHHLKSPKKIGNSIMALCPFHPDKEPSLSVFEDRTRFKCHGCEESGTAYRFLEKTDQLPGIDQRNKRRGRPVAAPTEDDVILTHGRLMEGQGNLEYLSKQRGWTTDILIRLKIGLTKDGYLTFPIRDYKGNLVNIRKYNYRKMEARPKFLPWANGLGKRVDLFQFHLIEGNLVYLFEGEPDSTLARQLGLEACAYAHGLSNIKFDHLNVLKDKDVVLCFDIDEPGRKAALKFSKYLARICPSVKNVHLPIEEPDNGDFTDFIMGCSGTQENALREFLALVGKTPKYVIPQAERAKIAKMDPTELKLEDAALAKNTGIKQKIQAMVSGKGPEPYLIPKKVMVACAGASDSKSCLPCGLSGTSEHEIKFGPYDPEIIQIAGQSQQTARGIYRLIADIPQRCSKWTSEVLESQNMDDLLLIPELSHDSDIDRPYVRRNAYIVDKSVVANRAYSFVGWTAPDPGTHQVVHVFEKAEPTVSSLDNFELSPSLKKALGIFQADTVMEIEKKIDEIHTDLEDHVTHIWGRRDLLWALDFAYHSVLRFAFDGTTLDRGWVEALVVGDTRVGKSNTINAMIKHNRAGELVGGENLSFAGLVGGINIVGTRKYITWGKLPLNDGRMVLIDEFSAMPLEEIERLSGIRSSGVAEITKIQSEKTMSRVRLVILSNPRSNMSIGSYDYGVTAIKSLIGKVEDIARFDFATVLASSEIPPEKINVRRQARGPHLFNSELCSTRVAWAWSRKANQVVFQDTAIDAILFCANALSKKFHPAIPLVEPSEQRIKLARLAVSVAAMVCSTEDWETLIVTRAHVEVVFNLLISTYTKTAMGYGLFSEYRFKEETLDKPEEVKTRVAHLGKGVVEAMMDRGQIQLMDLEDWTGQKNDARVLSSFLVKSRCLKKIHSFYVKTTAFIALLRELKKEMEDGKDFGNPPDEDNPEQQTGMF